MKSTEIEERFIIGNAILMFPNSFQKILCAHKLKDNGRNRIRNPLSRLYRSA